MPSKDDLKHYSVPPIGRDLKVKLSAKKGWADLMVRVEIRTEPVLGNGTPEKLVSVLSNSRLDGLAQESELTERLKPGKYVAKAIVTALENPKGSNYNFKFFIDQWLAIEGKGSANVSKSEFDAVTYAAYFHLTVEN